MDSLAIPHLTLSVLIVEQVHIDRDDLSLEEVSQFATELGPALHKVKRLGEVGRHLEVERNLGLSHVADVVWEAGQELCLLPHSPLPNVRIPLAFVTVVDLLAHVDELELELDAIGRDGLVRVDVDVPTDRVIRIESAQITFEVDLQGCSFEP